MNWLLAAAPPPKILVLPPAVADLGEADAAIEMWEHYSRKRLDDTQRLTVQVMMAQDVDAKWAAATTGREMPRQNGKGDEVEVVELWGLVQRSEAILHTVHDAVLLASQAQQRMLGVLEGHSDLRRRVKRKWQGTGQQMIEMNNGGVIWYRTRTGGGGRGVDDIDRLVVDEAQHATEEQLAAVSPTLLANANPQLNAMGTAGLAGKSAWWWRVRKRALSADPGSFGYVGHTAEQVSLDSGGRVEQLEVDSLDRALWGPCNPALASGRGVGLEFLEEQLRRLGAESFAREHLGVWDPPEDESDRATVVDLALWASLQQVPRERPARIALAISASLDRKWSYIGLAGELPDGRAFLQIIKTDRGTSWVLDELVRLKREWRPVKIVVSANDPAASLIPDAELRSGLRLVVLQSKDDARAAGMFVDGVRDETVCHEGGRLIDISVENARKKAKGDSFAFTGPADGSIDIGPLKAVALAHYALRSSRKATSTKRRTATVL